jgi:hypothetical protein
MKPVTVTLTVDLLVDADRAAVARSFVTRVLQDWLDTPNGVKAELSVAGYEFDAILHRWKLGEM